MSFLGVADVDPTRLAGLVERGLAMREDPDAYRGQLSGKSVGLFFQKQSLRTWVSCDVAAIQLGMHPIVIRNDQAGMGSRETPEDVGRVLDRYLDLLGMRVYDHTDLEAIDAATEIPVVNLLSDREHPCQTVADLMTVAARRPIDGAVITFVGDGNNVANSLLVGGTMLGAEVRIVCPAGYQPPTTFVEKARSHGTVVIGDDLSLVEGSDVVYTDVWASMGQEEEQHRRARDFAPYQVDVALFERAGPEAIFMHCLPAHRGEEVTHEVIEHERSVVFDQAENRLHSFKAILYDELV